MPTFRRGDVVRVPFPCTDPETRERRPALVVSDGGLGDRGTLLWVVMITSAANRRWPGDVPLMEHHTDVGLPAASRIRSTKIATIESDRADRLGTLPSAVWQQVEATLRGHLGLV